MAGGFAICPNGGNRQLQSVGFAQSIGQPVRIAAHCGRRRRSSRITDRRVKSPIAATSSGSGDVHPNKATRRGRGGAVSHLFANAGRENEGEQANNVAIGSGTIGNCGCDAANLYYRAQSQAVWILRSIKRRYSTENTMENFSTVELFVGI